MHIIHIHTKSKSNFIAKYLLCITVSSSPALILCVSRCLLLIPSCSSPPCPSFPLPCFLPSLPRLPDCCPLPLAHLLLLLITLSLSGGWTHSMFVSLLFLSISVLCLPLCPSAVHLALSLPPPFLSSPPNLSLTLPFLLPMCVS